MATAQSNLKNTHQLLEVTVAVCVRNGELTIRSCLDSLMNLDYPKEKLHFLIVDNGSTDSTAAILSDYTVAVIQEEKIGIGHARNTAWKHCTTSVIAFTDADCRVTAGWLREVIPAFDDPNVGIAGGDIITEGDDPFARFFESRQIVSNKEFSGDYPFSPPFLATANAIFRIDAIKQVDGFRTGNRGGEDADLCWRIQREGWSLKYIQGGVVYHDHRTTIFGIFKQALNYGHDGVSVGVNFFPETRVWIWWGLYYRALIALVKLPFCLVRRDPFQRWSPLLDVIRYTGLSLGRMYAGLKLRRLIA